MTHATYADLLRPETESRQALYDGTLILAASLLIALSAQVSVWIGPVPFTLQTGAVLLIGALLGSRRGSLAVGAYLLEGFAGLPVFAGWKAGPAVLLGPTGGYLIGFLVAIYLTGLLAERGWDRKTTTTALAMAVGMGVIYLLGFLHLLVFLGGDVESALWSGIVPFIPGDLAKIAVAAGVLPLGWKLFGTNER